MTELDLAKQCGATEVPVYTPTHRAVIGWLFGRDALTAFVERIRSEERERCAKVCEARGAAYRNMRAPGWFEVDHESAQCAAAIREASQ